MDRLKHASDGKAGSIPRILVVTRNDGPIVMLIYSAYSSPLHWLGHARPATPNYNAYLQDTPDNMNVLIIQLILTVVIIPGLALSVLGQRGICKWTAGDGIALHAFKSILNALTFNILGIVMNVAIPAKHCPIQSTPPDRSMRA